MDNGLSREIFIDGHGEIVGNSGATAGVCVGKFQGGKISGLYIHGFTTGAAVKNVGANSIDISGDYFDNNKYGYWGVGSGDGYAPNAIHLHDNLISNNPTWGVFLDGSGDGGVTGVQQNVITDNNIYEDN